MKRKNLKQFIETASERIELLYGPSQTPLIIDEIVSLLQSFKTTHKEKRSAPWNEQDVILICYGDSILNADEAPLKTVKRFFDEHLKGLVSTVHVLPFFPYSSDDGFSVIDYLSVNPELGDWDDITALGQNFDLMFDLVINHVSRESLWFIDFVNDRPPACYYFIEMAPQVDLSEVVRPRKNKVLTPVHTHRGLKHVWSTFSEDQIDLNFANPNVLLGSLRILLFYLTQGSRIIRLDAIAYLWKKLGTSCVNLEQTHLVVKLLRDIIDFAAPDVLLLTETNLPHDQNLSYFGDGDEAHMVYQFSLAPLLLHALHFGTSQYLNLWAKGRCQAPEGCTFLNFTASHDGIGLRPAEGLVPPGELETMIESMHTFGGFVSMKSNPDGSDSPYEINITYFDALKGTCRGRDQWQIARFLASQAIMLAIKGVPAIYIQSLVASPNDLKGMEKSGRTRSINRRKWNELELDGLLNNSFTPNHVVFKELKRLLAIRNLQAAFHPDAEQVIHDIGAEFFAIERIDPVSGQQLIAITNLTEWPQELSPELTEEIELLQSCDYDLVSEARVEIAAGGFVLQPYQVVWLTNN